MRNPICFELSDFTMLFAKIDGMHSKPDWGKRGVYAAYIIGSPTILLGLFAYFRPPDPTHPVRFDFLFRAVSIPVWLIISLLILAIGLALALRIFSPGLTRSLGKEPKVADVNSSPLPSTRQPSPKPAQAPVPVGNADDVVIETEYQLEIHLEADNSSAVHAITLRIDNNRLDAIHYLDVIAYSAFSFDGRQSQYRTHAAASGARMQMQDVVLPSESSKTFVLIHHPVAQNNLQLGNDTSRPMKWPENDKADVQKWRINVSFGARAYSNTIPPTGEVFQPTRFDLVVEWNKISNLLSIARP